MRWLPLAVLALALVAAGCGGSDDEPAASDETAVEETLTAETTTEESTTGDAATDTDAGFDFADEDCQALAGVGASIAAAFAGVGGSGGASTDELEELASRVPDEIRADVEILAEGFEEYAAKLEDIGIEAGATPSADQVQELQAAIASLDQEELTAASQRIEAWARENCQT